MASHPARMNHTGRVQTMLMLRWVLIIATSYLMLFSGEQHEAPVVVSLFVAAYFASNVLLTALLPRIRSQRLLDAGVVLFDTAAICIGLSLTDNISRDFFVLYFVVVFLGALTERIGLVVGAAVVSSLVHLTTTAQYVGFEELLGAGYILRIPFLFVVALFFGHLVQEERRAREVMKSEFLSTVSHDLKSPLAVIQSLAELLLEWDAGPLNNDQTNLVRRIHASARHVLALSHNLLNAARIEAGNLTLEMIPENMRPIVESAIAFARSGSDLKRIDLRFNPDPDLPVVRIDRIQMERVINNLIDNAIKYTPEGGTIEIALHRLIGKLALVVRDNGSGVPAEQVPNLFEKYQSRSRSEGSGLGLFIVKAIVQAHGGAVVMESAVGSGTTVTVTLPAATATGQEPALLSPRRWWRSQAEAA